MQTQLELAHVGLETAEARELVKVECISIRRACRFATLREQP